MRLNLFKIKLTKFMSKKFLPITILTSLTPFTMASTTTENPVGYQNGFANISLNYFDWSQRAENKSAHSTRKKDFAYFELEGGANFNWGELYGFFDVENPFHQRKTELSRNQRYAVKTTGRFYLGNSGFNLYGHLYGIWSLPGYKYGGNFHEINTLYGFGYNFSRGNFWLKPFLALHYVDQSFYSGHNGYVIGWVAGYSFQLWSQNFSITNWHEMEFNRAKRYGNGGKEGINGAIALWWTPFETLSAGIQYRYADNKLGDDFYHDGIIYTIKYNF